MISLIVKLLDLTEALLDHFVDVSPTLMQQLTDYEWIGDPYSLVTPKGNETIGALATVIHQGAMFLAQVMLLFNAEFYDTSVAVSGAAPL
jgi:hypothetical protein